MDTIQQNYIDNPEKYRQIIWDYTLTPEEFFAILNNRSATGWMGRDWAIARVLENVSYYDAISLVSIKTISQRWQYVRSKIFNKQIKKGYEYLLHKYTLSIAG